jgi:hypothetical protein
MTEPAELDAWADQLAEALGVPRDVIDIPLVLDLARDSAHAIARPAAPLTAFIVGYAAALAGGGIDEVRTAAASASRLATERA